MMYSALKINEQNDNMQRWHTPFSVGNQSIVQCLALTVASWLAYRFLRKQVRWFGIPISLRIFQFVVIHTVKGVVSEAEVDVFFLKFPCFLYDPANVSNLISGSSAFSKSHLHIWKFLLPILLKLSLKNFEHNLTSMGNEWNCLVVWTILGTALLWDWNENWPLPVLWPLLSFLNLLTYWNTGVGSCSFL